MKSVHKRVSKKNYAAVQCYQILYWKTYVSDRFYDNVIEEKGGFANIVM